MQINLDLMQIIIAIINFFVLYFILKKVLFRPVMKAMKDRQEGISKSIKENEEKKKTLDSLREEYDSAIKKREMLNEQIIQETKQKAAEEYSKIVQTAKAKSRDIVEVAKSKINEERELMLESVKKDISSLSVLIAEKVTDENMNTEKNYELADKFVREVNLK